jgi:hypothetical protein
MFLLRYVRSIKEEEERLVLFGIRIMYLRGETYLPNGQSFQRARTVKTQVSVLATYIISMKWNLFSLWNMWRYAHLALTTITQLYLTFVTFLKYYQFEYIINNVISSRFKCYCCTYIIYWMFMKKDINNHKENFLNYFVGFFPVRLPIVIIVVMLERRIYN